MFAALVLVLSPVIVDAAPTPAPVDEFAVLADDWARPRTGASVAALPAVQTAVKRWMERPASRIAIVHPGGEGGSLWGREIRDWLVALGVPPQHLLLQPGGPREDAVILRLERAP